MDSSATYIIHNPIGSHGKRSSLCAHLKRVDLSGVEPRDAKDSHTEGGKECEEKGHGNCSILERVSGVSFGACEDDGDNNPASHARECGGHHNRSSTVSLDDKICEDCEEEVIDGACCCENACSVAMLTFAKH